MFVFSFCNDDVYVDNNDFQLHQWACVYDKTVTTGHNRIEYRYGNLLGSNSTLGAYTGTAISYIGQSPWNVGDTFDGTIDEMRIWSTVRSKCDIQSYLI
jgi:hypothetical protein